MNEEELLTKSYKDIKENYSEEFNNTSDEFKNEFLKALEDDIKYHKDYTDNLEFTKVSAEANASENYRDLVDVLNERIEDIRENYKDQSDDFIKEKVNEERETFHNEKLASVFDNVNEIEKEIKDEKEYVSNAEIDLNNFKEDFKDVLDLSKNDTDELSKSEIQKEIYSAIEDKLEINAGTMNNNFHDFVDEKFGLNNADLVEDVKRDGLSEVVNSQVDAFMDHLEFSNDKFVAEVAEKTTSEDVLDKLANSENAFIKATVAGNENTSSETLDKIADKTDNERVLREVAGNSNTSAETLEKLSNEDSIFIKLELAKNENTSAETLDKLSNLNLDDISQIKNNNNLSDSIKDKMNEIQENQITELKTAIAGNENTSPETLEKLASSDDQKIRDAVLDNPNVSERAIEIAEKVNEISSSNEVSSNIKTEEASSEKSSSSLKM